MAPFDETREGQERKSVRSKNGLILNPAKIIFVKFRETKGDQSSSLWDLVGSHTRPITCQGESGEMAHIMVTDVMHSSIWHVAPLQLQTFTSQKRMCAISSANAADPWCFQSKEPVKTGQRKEILNQLEEQFTSLARWIFAIGGMTQNLMVSTPKVVLTYPQSADRLYLPCWEVEFEDEQKCPVYVAGWYEGAYHAAALHAATFLLDRTWNLTKGTSKSIADLRGY